MSETCSTRLTKVNNFAPSHSFIRCFIKYRLLDLITGGSNNILALNGRHPAPCLLSCSLILRPVRTTCSETSRFQKCWIHFWGWSEYSRTLNHAFQISITVDCSWTFFGNAMYWTDKHRTSAATGENNMFLCEYWLQAHSNNEYFNTYSEQLQI